MFLVADNVVLEREDQVPQRSIRRIVVEMLLGSRRDEGEGERGADESSKVHSGLRTGREGGPYPASPAHLLH